MTPSPAPLRYLGGYPPNLLAQVQPLIDAGKLGENLLKRYPERHEVQSDKALYDHVLALKQARMRSSEPVSKVAYDNKLKVIQHALGTLYVSHLENAIYCKAVALSTVSAGQIILPVLEGYTWLFVFVLYLIPIVWALHRLAVGAFMLSRKRSVLGQVDD